MIIKVTISVQLPKKQHLSWSWFNRPGSKVSAPGILWEFLILTGLVTGMRLLGIGRPPTIQKRSIHIDKPRTVQPRIKGEPKTSYGQCWDSSAFWSTIGQYTPTSWPFEIDMKESGEVSEKWQRKVPSAIKGYQRDMWSCCVCVCWQFFGLRLQLGNEEPKGAPEFIAYEWHANLILVSAKTFMTFIAGTIPYLSTRWFPGRMEAVHPASMKDVRHSVSHND